MDMPPNQYWYCSIVSFSMGSGSLCSTMFIVFMTFERFYSIIRPHKTASFNTVKKAKFIIGSIVVLSTLFNIPQILTTSYRGRNCLAQAKMINTWYGEMYFWIEFNLNFAVPFVSILGMNTVIIHKLRTRSMSLMVRSGGEGQIIKSSETQIYITLLLVTFSFLLLITPGFTLVFALSNVNPRSSPYTYAWYFFCYHIGQKTNFTNFGVNFFLYVLSGKKFREDLLKLFKCFNQTNAANQLSLDSSTKISTIETVDQR